MPKILSRAVWTSTGFGFARLTSRHLNKSNVIILAPHWPGAGNRTYGPKPTLEQSAAALRGWRNMHVNQNGWADIGYNFAIDQAGRIFTCAGASYAAAHASNNNFRALGVLFIVGNNEEPTSAARASFRALGRWLREEYGFPNLTEVRDHGRLPGESTACAGQPIRRHVDAGNLSITGSSSGGSSSTPAAPSKPSTPSGPGLTVDGRCGRKTISALQRDLGVTVDGRAGEQTWTALQRKLSAPFVDGIISRQSYRANELGNGIVPARWEFTGRGSSGSQTVQALQSRLGVDDDGIWFEATTRALQQALNNGSL